MNETATPAMNTAAKPRKKTAAKSPEDKIKALKEKQAQLDARIKSEKAKIRKEERKQDTRRKIVAGAIALENMEHDENFKGVMEGLIKRHVKDSDKALFDL